MQVGKLLRLLSELRPRIRPLYRQRVRILNKVTTLLRALNAPTGYREFLLRCFCAKWSKVLNGKFSVIQVHNGLKEPFSR